MGVKIYDFVLRLKFYCASILRWVTKSKHQFTIAPEEAVTIFGHSFSREGNHFIINFLNDEKKQSENAFIGSAIAQFHDNFQPKTTGAALGVQLAEDIPLFVFPWGTFGFGKLTTTKSTKNSRFCGPSEPEFIKDEEKRIRKLAALLKKEGYTAFIYPRYLVNKNRWLSKIRCYARKSQNGCIVVSGIQKIGGAYRFISNKGSS